MADKDKTKLKVILKLPKSSSQLKSPLAPAARGGNSSFSAPASQSAPSQDQHRKNVQSHHAAPSSAQSASFNSVVRSTTASGSATFAASVSPHVPSPPPPKKRKFKSVEQTGALGLGAIVVGSPAAVAVGLGFAKDAGGGVPAASGHPGSPPTKKSHKKQAKPSLQADGVPVQAVAAVPPRPLPQPLAQPHPQPPAESLSKPLLEGVLDKLQKKDTYGVFAEPVDPAQVPDYYDIIKEPMDFGTMRKKIQKGSYVTVELFEGDIYLICSNAMRYNGPETIYYKQARSIRDMARKALEGIRAQLTGEVGPTTSHRKKPPPPKKSQFKKPVPIKSRFDGVSSDFASGATLASEGESHVWSNLTGDGGKVKKGVSIDKLVGTSEDSEGPWSVQPVVPDKVDTQEEPAGAPLKPMGPKDGRRPLSTEEYHRNTYKQRLLPAHGQGPPLVAIGGELRQLVPVGLHMEHAYARSLAQFGADLSPSAWRFVARKLQKVLAPNVPFGPGWVGEQDARAVPKKLPVSENQAEGLFASQGRAGSTSANTMEKNPAVPNGGQHGGYSALKVSSSAAFVGALPASNSPPLMKSTSQGSVDHGAVPASDTTSGHSSGAIVKTFNPPSKSTLGMSSLSKVAQTQQSVSHIGAAGSAAPVTSSVGPDDLSAQAWAQARVMSLSHQVEAKKKFLPGSQGYHSHSSQVQPPADLSQQSLHHSTANRHQYTTNGSQTMQSSPSRLQFSSSVPQTLPPSPNVAQYSSSVPQTLQPSANLPQRLSNVPQTLQPSTSVPPRSLNMPQTLQTSATMPQFSSSAPQTLQPSSGLPQFSVSALQSSGNVPQIPGSVPQSIQPSNVSQISVNTPQTSGNVRQSSANVPPLSASTPQMSANIPQVLASASQLLAATQMPANVPPTLQPYNYGDYNQFFVRLPHQQSTGAPATTLSNSHSQVQHPEPTVPKTGSGEQLGSPNFHAHLNVRTLPSLQQSPLQQRAMPPDLNVALVSPSALQSPSAPQGSTPRNSHQLDLKLQL